MKPPAILLRLVLLIGLALFGCGDIAEDAASTPDDAVTDDAGSDDAVSEDAEVDEAETDDTAVDEVATDDALSDEDSAEETTDHDDADHSHDEDTDHSHVGFDPELFFDGAVVGDVETQDCTLSDGTETSCYAITIAGSPANHDIGPFCPSTVESSADEGGVWFDGTGLYDIDGEFIEGLAELYEDDNWLLYDEDGNVNITETAEAFDAAARPNVAEEYQNHCVEGQMDWLAGGEPVQTSVLIPVTPVAADAPAQANGDLGITLNGVVIAAPAPVDAILGAYTIAAFDDCGGHINPIAGYHLHGALGCSEVGEADGDDTPIFAVAMDGYPIHSPLPEGSTVELDECNGHFTEAEGYHYHAQAAEENGVITCYMGVTVEGTGGGGGDRPERPERGTPPDEG